MKYKLPSYPLITIDPYCSVWLPGDKLNKTDAELWAGFLRRMTGYIHIDGTRRRFLGRGNFCDEYVWQTDRDITPLVSIFTLESDEIKLKVRFWSPMFPDEIYKLSLPCGFIDYEVESTDGKAHDIEIHFSLHREFCDMTTNNC